jgi:hypothetical protein
MEETKEFGSYTKGVFIALQKCDLSNQFGLSIEFCEDYEYGPLWEVP